MSKKTLKKINTDSIRRTSVNMDDAKSKFLDNQNEYMAKREK